MSKLMWKLTILLPTTVSVDQWIKPIGKVPLGTLSQKQLETEHQPTPQKTSPVS